jgi:hypothetical protein
MSQILIEKNGIVIFKEKDDKDNVHIKFDIENSKLDLTKIVNIEFFKLIYDLNKDIFESINTKKINENEANITLLCKDLFSDIGLPQYYYHFNVKRQMDANDRIYFIFTSLEGEKTELKSANSVFMPLKKCEIVCYIKTISCIQLNIEISASPIEMFSAYFEKMINTILFKLFNRVKHFIYNINYVNNNKI